MKRFVVNLKKTWLLVGLSFLMVLGAFVNTAFSALLCTSAFGFDDRSAWESVVVEAGGRLINEDFDGIDIFEPAPITIWLPLKKKEKLFAIYIPSGYVIIRDGDLTVYSPAGLFMRIYRDGSPPSLGFGFDYTCFGQWSKEPVIATVGSDMCILPQGQGLFFGSYKNGSPIPEMKLSSTSFGYFTVHKLTLAIQEPTGHSTKINVAPALSTRHKLTTTWAAIKKL